MSFEFDPGDERHDSYFIDCGDTDDFDCDGNVAFIVPQQSCPFKGGAMQDHDGETVLDLCIGCIASVHHLVTTV